MFSRKNYNEIFDSVHASDETRRKILNIGTERKITRIPKRAVLTAAIVCVFIACGTVAYATNIFGWKTALIPDEYKVDFSIPDENGNSEPEIVDFQAISIAGGEDTDEYKATAEWNNWRNEYTKDRDFEVPYIPADDRYLGTARLYSIESDEMLEKLLEIGDKYSLDLHTSCRYLNYEDDDLADTVDDFAVEFKNTIDTEKLDLKNGTLYEDGSFNLQAELNMPGTNSKTVVVARSISGTLPAESWYLTCVDKYRQWSYTTADGDVLDIIRNPDKNINTGDTYIFYQESDAYIVLNTYCRSYKDAEELAEAIDFSGMATIYRDGFMTRCEPCIPRLDEN